MVPYCPIESEWIDKDKITSYITKFTTNLPTENDLPIVVESDVFLSIKFMESVIGKELHRTIFNNELNISNQTELKKYMMAFSSAIEKGISPPKVIENKEYTAIVNFVENFGLKLSDSILGQKLSSDNSLEIKRYMIAFNKAINEGISLPRIIEGEEHDSYLDLVEILGKKLKDTQIISKKLSDKNDSGTLAIRIVQPKSGFFN